MYFTKKQRFEIIPKLTKKIIGMGETNGFFFLEEYKKEKDLLYEEDYNGELVHIRFSYDSILKFIKNLDEETVYDMYKDQFPEDAKKEFSENKIDLYTYKIINTEVPDFWEKDCLRVFVSHSVKNYQFAKKLKDELKNSSISCFIAHKDIKPTTQWQAEIEKALNSMELMVTIITEDFKKSWWTNQEVGFALGRKIPIVCIKLKQDQKLYLPGLIYGMQAIVWNEPDITPHSTSYIKLLKLIEKKFPKYPFHLKNFFKSRGISAYQAKETFMKIINLEFNDVEIETIVKEITDKNKKHPGNYGGTNQLTILLLDPISLEHLSQLPENQRNQYKYYADLLNDKILSQHTQKRFSITKPDGQTHCKIIDNQTIKISNQKVTNKQTFEEIPF